MIKFDYSLTKYEWLCKECMFDETEKNIFRLRCLGKSAQEILNYLEKIDSPMSTSTLSRKILKIDNKIKKIIRDSSPSHDKK